MTIEDCLVLVRGVVQGTGVRSFAQLVQRFNRTSIQDVAAAAQEALAWGMAILDTRIAEERGKSSIAFSGGVAHNDHISPEISDLCGVNGHRFFANHLVPRGDGGASLGRAAEVELETD